MLSSAPSCRGSRPCPSSTLSSSARPRNFPPRTAVEQFSEQNVQMRREIEKLDAVVADYAAQVATLKIEVEQKRTELENVRKASAREASDLRRELAMKDSEVFELRRRHDDDATTLESQLRSLQSTLSQKEAECHQLKARLTSLFKTFTQLLTTHSISCDGKFFFLFSKVCKIPEICSVVKTC